MQFEISIDGTSVVKADIDASKLLSLLSAAVALPPGPSKSEPMTPSQAEELIRRVHVASVGFLKQMAERNGQMTFGEVRQIFGYAKNDWNAFSNGHNRGMNTSLGNILNKTGVRLVHWNDDEKVWDDKARWDEGHVYIDGQALQSLKVAFGI